MGDWTSATYITSQIAVVIAYILLASSYFIKSRSKLLLTAIGSNTGEGIAWVLLGGWVGVWMCIIAIARDIVAHIVQGRRTPAQNAKIMRADWWWLGLWTLLFAVSTILFNHIDSSGLGWLAFLTTMIFTISIWQKNIFIYRLLGIFVSIGWIIYNFLLNSVFGWTLESILLIFVIAGLITYLRNQKRLTK